MTTEHAECRAKQEEEQKRGQHEPAVEGVLTIVALFQIGRRAHHAFRVGSRRTCVITT